VQGGVRAQNHLPGVGEAQGKSPSRHRSEDVRHFPGGTSPGAGQIGQTPPAPARPPQRGKQGGLQGLIRR
jgi:hypothetical protein